MMRIGKVIFPHNRFTFQKLREANAFFILPHLRNRLLDKARRD